jgi:hypothetical protein
MEDEHFRKYIIQPALIPLKLHSLAIENILVATKNKESSRGKYLVQNNAPITGAKGIYQIEHVTHRDVKIWLTNRFNKDLIDKIMSLCYLSELPPDDALIYNLRYATIIARLVYYRAKPPLPDAKDAEGCFEYYKQFYNGPGKSTHENAIEFFKEACNA